MFVSSRKDTQIIQVVVLHLLLLQGGENESAYIRQFWKQRWEL